MSVKLELPASVEEVFAWICDPDWIVQRGLDLGELEMACELSEEGDEVHIVTTRLTEAELPSFLARLFDAQQEVVESEVWSGNDKRMQAAVTLTMTGKPVVITAARSIKATGADSCVWEVSHKAKVSVPLIGGKAAKFVEQTADEKALAEMQYLAEALAEA